MLFIVALLWPLSFLRDVRWHDDAIALFVYSFLILPVWGAAAVAPKAQSVESQFFRDTLRLALVRVAVALIGLELLLVVFLRIFGGDHAGVSPHDDILAPIAEMAAALVPKFQSMAAKMSEIGENRRINVVVCAWLLALAGQIPIAVVWWRPFWRLRSVTMLTRKERLPYAALIIMFGFVVVLSSFILFASDVHIQRRLKEVFFDFERNDFDLFYRALLSSTTLGQLLVLLVFAAALRRIPRQ
jgi:hypothetical protein